MSHELLVVTNHIIYEMSIGHIHGTDDFLGQNICQGQRDFLKWKISYKVLIPMGDYNIMRGGMEQFQKRDSYGIDISPEHTQPCRNSYQYVGSICLL